MSITSALNNLGTTVPSIRGPIKRHATSDHYLVAQTGRHVEFFDDFMWSGTSDGGGPWDPILASGSTIVGGTTERTIGLTFDGGDNDENIIRGASAWYLPEEGKDFKMEMRLKVERIDGQIFFGMGTHGAIGEAVAIANANCLGFQLDGDANLEMVCTSGTTPADVDTTVDVVADSYIVATLEYDGTRDEIRTYVDGVHKTTTSNPTLPVVQLSPTIGGRAVSTTSPNITVDYVYILAEM